ncbi:hypothetical protein M9194_14780 [Vibrio sp. S4M6]|uniref:hypothetical protein n=1 Tax=Vibrio sinus TaxID=2946865 RepID=UPI00202A56AD|nr:hypothetical protein [Vibrio sinus]MCL9782698.1 hypothetical protein [Vibrio sinus]
MYISAELFSFFGACNETLERLHKRIGNQTMTLQQFLKKAHIQSDDYGDLIWYAKKCGASEKDIIGLGVRAAALTLGEFESVLPNDKRPRQALEIAGSFCRQEVIETSLSVMRSVGASRAGRIAWEMKEYGASAAAISTARLAWATWVMGKKPEAAEEMVLKVITYVSACSYSNERRVKRFFSELFEKVDNEWI